MYLLLSHLLIVLGVLAVALAMILALQQRRTPQSSAAWILFIILVPYVAVPVFLALGFRKERARFAPIRFAGGEDAAASPAARLFARLGAAPPSAGNALALHASPAAALAALEGVVASARQRLEVLLYIVADDDSGRRFVQALTAKRAEGVEVRLIVDRLGTLSRPRPALAAFVRAGGELRFFSPFLHPFDNGRLNLRNHRKLVIADGARVWAGGRNVGDAYLASAPGLWTDLSYDLAGPAVRDFAAVFAADWGLAGPPAPAVPAAPEPAPEAAGTALVQLVPAGPDEPLDVLHDGLVSAIHRADRRIWLATPYFVPTEALSSALCTAARRGLDVRLFLPVKSNQRLADLARGPYLREVVQAGCRPFLYRPGMLHAKAGLIDGAGWVGSANFDVRSMLLNFETALMLYDPASVGGLEAWFAALTPDCDTALRRPRALRRLLEGIFRLGAPIL